MEDKFVELTNLSMLSIVGSDQSSEFIGKLLPKLPSSLIELKVDIIEFYKDTEKEFCRLENLKILNLTGVYQSENFIEEMAILVKEANTKIVNLFDKFTDIKKLEIYTIRETPQENSDGFTSLLNKSLKNFGIKLRDQYIQLLVGDFVVICDPNSFFRNFPPIGD